MDSDMDRYGWVIVYPSNMRSAVQVEGNDLEHESHKGQRTQRSVESGGEAQGFYFGVTREPHDARGVFSTLHKLFQNFSVEMDVCRACDYLVDLSTDSRCTGYLEL